MPTESNDKLARLTARLAIPERAPDEAFVARVELEMEARAIIERAARERRGQLAVDISAAGALLLAAKELGTIAKPAAELLMPLPSGMGAAAFVCALVSLAVAAVVSVREERA